MAHAAGGPDALLEHATGGVETAGVGQAIGLMQAHVQRPHLPCGHMGHARLGIGVQANAFGQACAHRRGWRLQQLSIKAPGAARQGLRQAHHLHAHRHLVPAGRPDLGGALLCPPTRAAPGQQHHHRTPQPALPSACATQALPQQQRPTQAQRQAQGTSVNLRRTQHRLAQLSSHAQQPAQRQRQPQGHARRHATHGVTHCACLSHDGVLRHGRHPHGPPGPIVGTRKRPALTLKGSPSRAMDSDVRQAQRTCPTLNTETICISSAAWLRRLSAAAALCSTSAAFCCVP